MRRVTLHVETWPVRGVFRISRGSQTEIVVVTAEIREGSLIGRGECRPYAHYGKTPELVRLSVEMLEQPFPAEADACLASLPKLLFFCFGRARPFMG